MIRKQRQASDARVPLDEQGRPLRMALITGSARRLGRRIALALSHSGYGVVINYRRSERSANALVDLIAEGGGYARALRADVGDKVDVASLFGSIEATEGRLDVLVNNVGNYNVKPLRDVTPEDWDETIQVNLNGAFYACYHARPLLEQSGGCIVNIGYAGSDLLRANTEATAYQVSKTGLLLLTRSLAAALGPHGVRCNMVSPGQLENSVDLPSDLRSTIPLGRAGRLDEVTDALGFLLDNDYLTGVNIDVAGGYRT